MSEHELSEEKIAELWDASECKSTFFDDLGEHSKILFSSFARAAYDLGKAAQNDDGFIPCEYGDIRKGDTVERTIKYAHGTVVTTVGVIDRLSGDGRAYDSGGLRVADDFGDATYRRKPAPVRLPDPEKHPVILDDCNEAWFWSDGKYRHEGGVSAATPAFFGSDWTPAKVVAKGED